MSERTYGSRRVKGRSTIFTRTVLGMSEINTPRRTTILSKSPCRLLTPVESVFIKDGGIEGDMKAIVVSHTYMFPNMTRDVQTVCGLHSLGVIFELRN